MTMSQRSWAGKLGLSAARVNELLHSLKARGVVDVQPGKTGIIVKLAA